MGGGGSSDGSARKLRLASDPVVSDAGWFGDALGRNRRGEAMLLATPLPVKDEVVRERQGE